MKKLAFATALIMILFLFLYMQFSKPLEIHEQNQIKSLKDNQKIVVSGKVISDYEAPYFRILKLDNNLSLMCRCKGLENLKGKRITAIGLIDTFYGKIEVLKIRF